MWELRFHLAQYVLYPDAANRQSINQAGPKQLAIVEETFKAFAAMEGLAPEEVQAHKRMVEAYEKYKEKRPRMVRPGRQGQARGSVGLSGHADQPGGGRRP